MFKILIVEDSLEYQKIISRCLSNYKLICIDTLNEAAKFLRNESFDLVLLDINLPDGDGYSLLAEMQAQSISTPVLCLTGRKEITDKVTAFSLGADDYITKPFDPIELTARVDGKLEKNSTKKANELITTIDDLEIDHARHKVSILKKGTRADLELTQTEFKILACLARRPDQVYSRDQLLVAAWGDNAKVLDRVVDAHVCLLRKKLGSHAHYIKSVTGIGYRLQAQKKKAA